ncbi:hypothetical protein BC332_08086 [Capsicum chinense]|nr:hypothetical protein BC332_08086 [Capsicum chinense]
MFRELNKVEFDEGEKVVGVTSEEETAKCNTNDSHSPQVILPQKQLGRKSDMKYIAFFSTEAEIDDPEKELKPGVDILGAVDEIFYETYDKFVHSCVNNGFYWVCCSTFERISKILVAKAEAATFEVAEKNTGANHQNNISTKSFNVTDI